jgi:hypothetical protein
VAVMMSWNIVLGCLSLDYHYDRLSLSHLIIAWFSAVSIVGIQQIYDNEGNIHVVPYL